MNNKSFFLSALIFFFAISLAVGQEFIDPIPESQYNAWLESSEIENQQKQEALAEALKQERIDHLESFFTSKITELSAKYNELKKLSEKKFAKKSDIAVFKDMMEDAKLICNIVQTTTQAPADIILIAETELLVALKAKFDSLKQKLDSLSPPTPFNWFRYLIIVLIVAFILYSILMPIYNKRKAKKAQKKAQEDAKKQQTQAKTEQLKSTTILKI
jgi:large-conductance mechanosensitive channel